MSKQFDEIANSLINGQRKQAYKQMCELDGYERADMLDYFARELQNVELAIDAARTFFRQSAR